MSEPKDKNNEIYILYILHGIVLIMPWHTMKEAFNYFKSIEEKTKPEYFANYFGDEVLLAIRIICMTINIFVPKRSAALSSRMLFSIAMDGFVMAFIVLLLLSDFKRMPDLLSWMTIVSNVVMNIFCGIHFSSAFGSAAVMPMKYTTALIIGLTIDFVFVISTALLFNAKELDPYLKSIFYFFTAIVLHIFCIVLEITSKTNKCRVYYQELAEFTTTRAEEMDISGNRYLYVFTQIYEQLLDTFLTVFVSFTIFPNVIKSIETSNNWIPVIFIGVSLLISSTFHLIGVITAQYFRYPTTESMIAFTSARLIVIPITLFFNYRPKSIVRTLPVLFKSDLLYWIFISIGSTTGGHLWALSMMYATKEVRPQYAHIAGMMSSLIFNIAISFGFNFALVLPNFI